MTDQIRRASRSVCANIGEAWRKRRYAAAFVAKLSDADAEATEVRVWLDFAKACSFLSEQEHAELDGAYNSLGASLSRMMDEPKKWTRTSPSSPLSPPSSAQHPPSSLNNG